MLCSLVLHGISCLQTENVCLVNICIITTINIIVIIIFVIIVIIINNGYICVFVQMKEIRILQLLQDQFMMLKVEKTPISYRFRYTVVAFILVSPCTRKK